MCHWISSPSISKKLSCMGVVMSSAGAPGRFAKWDVPRSRYLFVVGAGTLAGNAGEVLLSLVTLFPPIAVSPAPGVHSSTNWIVPSGLLKISRTTQVCDPAQPNVAIMAKMPNRPTARR